MNDPHDPFNRAPLKLEEVVPLPELKQKIQDYKSEKIAMKMSMKK